uniref:Large ribosomal subunit protein bL9 n=1 Tax=Desulfobacca acetoxidans TaxID=60893 RepID=A0A7C3WIP1_9BACT
MKVILTEYIPSLGEPGKIVEVSRGYARNFLIPQGKALEATPGNLARFEQERKRYETKVKREEAVAKAAAAQLEGLTVTIAQRVGEQERLYGSVTAAMIAEALAKKGFDIDKKQLELPEPLKKLGEYDVTVRLGPQVKATIRVQVVPER